MQINADINIKSLESAFASLGKQAPFAMALSLTKTAQQAQKDATQELDKDLDNPTPFTKKAVGIKKATKTSQVAHVFIKDKQASYLKYQIKGGTRTASKGQQVVIPQYKQRNKYGNLPRNKLRRLREQGDMVVFKDGMIAQRTKRGLKPIAFQSKQATYKPRYDFHQTVIRSARKNGKHEAIKAIRQAINTAR
ncbi:hypothetical protein CRN37_09475 [Vibrio vulnificus]|uniref:hypothetical protein n=1 Tax=Vibrio vulnificus TaxID=672 RepID=UPI000CD19F09|nr:hypothetical protein [Vibrio vulnificus]POC58486.1 hypothetical protein CRN37_09475 [Vibrio vulnificus]POC73056.1 hypothetical protein CRN34_09315 [Vibrio vulnificus]